MSCRTMVTPYHAWEVKVHGTKLSWTALPERSLDKALWNSSCQPSRKLSLMRSADHFSRDKKLSMAQNKPEDWFQVLLLLAYRD